MKKVFIFCLFMLLSLGLFAQKLNTDGEAHFDKLVGVKFTKPYYPNGENYDFFVSYTITKKGNDYYLTGKEENPGTTEIENVKSKLKIYKKIFLKDEAGSMYAYDVKEDTLALIINEETLETFIYYRKSSKK